jgi:WD40 repeat protein
MVNHLGHSGRGRPARWPTAWPGHRIHRRGAESCALMAVLLVAMASCGRDDQSANMLAVNFSTQAVAFSPDGKILAVTGGDPVGEVALWNIAAGRQIAVRMVPGPFEVDAVAFSPDGKTLATGADDGAVTLWGPVTGRVRAIGTFAAGTPSGTPVGTLAFSPDGKMLVMGNADATTVWDVATRRQVARFPLAAYSLAFSADGKTLALVGDGDVELCDLDTHQVTATLTTGYEGWVSAVAFSPDGKTLATSSYDGMTTLWDIPARHLTATLSPVQADLYAKNQGNPALVAFRPGGKSFVSGSDGTLTLWDVAKRRATATLVSTRSARWTAMAISPDGKTVAAVPEDGYGVGLWRLSP